MSRIEAHERTVQLVVIAAGGDWSPKSWNDDPPWGRVCRVIRKTCREGEADALRLHLNHQAQCRGDRGWVIKAPVGAPLRVGSVCARILDGHGSGQQSAFSSQPEKKTLIADR